MSSVEDIAAEFGFEVEDFREHFAQAQESHDWATAQKQHRAELAKLARVAAEWAAISDDAKALIASDIDFMNPNAFGDMVAKVQTAARNALQDLEFLAGRGRATQLYALRVFALFMKQYWEARRDERFGCRFRDNDGAFVGPSNQASEFFCACVGLLGKDYSETNCEAVMKYVQQGETPTRTATEVAEPTLQEIRDALQRWKRN